MNQQVEYVIAPDIELAPGIVQSQGEIQQRAGTRRALIAAVGEQHIPQGPEAANTRVARDGPPVIENEFALKAVAVGRRDGQCQDDRQYPAMQRTAGGTRSLGGGGRVSWGIPRGTESVRFSIPHPHYFSSSVCRPHSVLAKPLQRPARSSSPNITARVQGQQPMLV